MTRGWLPQRAGSPIPVGGGDGAVVPLNLQDITSVIKLCLIYTVLLQ